MEETENERFDRIILGIKDHFITEEQKRRMILKAIKKFGEISPCGKNIKEGLFGGFTQFNGDTLFWFNTADHSTHMIVEKPENNEEV